jgi:rRNA maturation endonuclease Nob1
MKPIDLECLRCGAKRKGEPDSICPECGSSHSIPVRTIRILDRMERATSAITKTLKGLKHASGS